MLIKKCNCYRNIGKKILICKKKTLGHLCTVKKSSANVCDSWGSHKMP